MALKNNTETKSRIIIIMSMLIRTSRGGSFNPLCDYFFIYCFHLQSLWDFPPDLKVILHVPENFSHVLSESQNFPH